MQIKKNLFLSSLTQPMKNKQNSYTQWGGEKKKKDLPDVLTNLICEQSRETSHQNDFPISRYVTRKAEFYQ